MNDQEIIKFQKRARFVANKKGYPQLADDFAQEIIINWLEGHGQHQTVDQYFIDYLRQQYGRTGRPGGDARSRLDRTAEDITKIRNLAVEPEEQRSDRRFNHLFRGIQHTIYTLRFLEEMNLKEIGEILGVTESRISQRVSEIEKVIQDQMILEQGIERMEWDDNFSKLMVNWIKL